MDAKSDADVSVTDVIETEAPAKLEDFMSGDGLIDNNIAVKDEFEHSIDADE